MPKIDNFPAIRDIASRIAYDNGMINQTCDESTWMAATDEVLGADGVDETDLETLEEWCDTLTGEERETLACGEYEEMQALIRQCPNPALCGLFQDLFENG